MLIRFVTFCLLRSSMIVAEPDKQLSQLPANRRLSHHVYHSSAATVGTQTKGLRLR